MGSIVGSSNLNSGKEDMSTPAPPPYALATLSSSFWSSASVAGVASTIFPPAFDFLSPYSRILSTNKPWIGSDTAVQAGALTERHRLAIETVDLREAPRDIIIKSFSLL